MPWLDAGIHVFLITGNRGRPALDAGTAFGACFPAMTAEIAAC